MGWGFEEISLEDLMKLIKGFVDILVLASGYQSSGLLAHWDSLNIKKAFQWGFFFEDVFNHLSSSNAYEDSVKELDSALSRMTSDPSFPQGLAHLSSATLKNARVFVLKHFLHTSPLRDTHLRALLMAAVDTELEELSGSECSCLKLYFSKLALHSTSTNLVAARSLITDLSTMEIGDCINRCSRKCIIEELEKRKSAVSCLLSAETGLNVISHAIRHNSNDVENFVPKNQNKQGKSLGEDQQVEFAVWSNLKSKSLSYFLDKRTLRLVSGASIIFSAPRTQWVQVFKRMNISAEANEPNLCEVVEILLLGCIARKWSHVIEHFISISFDFTSIPKQFLAVCNFFSGNTRVFHSNEDRIDSKECDIIEYLTELLGDQLGHLWKLSPALVAVAIPSWSTLFKVYLSEIEAQLRGSYSTIRCCGCPRDEQKHKDCKLAERIWCLYNFHVRGLHLADGSGST